jgi:hypothetical protein
LLRRLLRVVSAIPTGKLQYPHQPMAMLDHWGHTLKAPKWIQHEICNEFDVWIGLYEDDDIPYAEQDCS